MSVIKTSLPILAGVGLRWDRTNSCESTYALFLSLQVGAQAAIHKKRSTCDTVTQWLLAVCDPIEKAPADYF